MWEPELLSLELLGDHLAPAARRGAEIDHALGALKDLELLVDLEELVSASCTIAIFLCFPVIDILLQI